MKGRRANGEGSVYEFIQKIKLINIEPNRDQPRRTFDEESIGELAESIKKYLLNL